MEEQDRAYDLLVKDVIEKHKIEQWIWMLSAD